jgi:hypothetical protein
MGLSSRIVRSHFDFLTSFQRRRWPLVGEHDISAGGVLMDKSTSSQLAEFIPRTDGREAEMGSNGQSRISSQFHKPSLLSLHCHIPSQGYHRITSKHTLSHSHPHTPCEMNTPLLFMGAAQPTPIVHVSHAQPRNQFINRCLVPGVLMAPSVPSRVYPNTSPGKFNEITPRPVDPSPEEVLLALAHAE